MGRLIHLLYANVAIQSCNKDWIMNLQEMESTATALVAPGKGILAADESFGTIEKRFQAVNIPVTEENRRRYRELLFTTPKLGDAISAAILFDETIRQKTADGTPFIKILAGAGIIPGIKVDAGAKTMPAFPGEKITEGLDGLRERFAEYAQLGARFAKWRAVITIRRWHPHHRLHPANAHALARYAALAQEADLVPIVEPEVLMDGDHTLDRCDAVTTETLQIVFERSWPHIASSSKACSSNPTWSSPARTVPNKPSHEIADATVPCLLRTVPAAVPGIAFLSGGQSEIQATENLNAINQLGPHPWQLSFSFGRALQNSALKTWAGDPAKVAEAQKAFLRRAASQQRRPLRQIFPHPRNRPHLIAPHPLPGIIRRKATDLAKNQPPWPPRTNRRANRLMIYSRPGCMKINSS